MANNLLSNAMDSTFGGIVHYDPTGALAHLPLEEVRVNALVVDGEFIESYYVLADH